MGAASATSPAASSGPILKAPGSAGGYLPINPARTTVVAAYRASAPRTGARTAPHAGRRRARCFGRELLRERPRQHELGLVDRPGPRHDPIKSCRHKPDERGFDSALDVLDGVPGVPLAGNGVAEASGLKFKISYRRSLECRRPAHGKEPAKNSATAVINASLDSDFSCL
jgi:hypothetical protein